MLKKLTKSFWEAYYYKERVSVLLLKFIKKCFECLPINKDKIVFDNFGGGGFADHPRYIAEEIHRRGLSWKMIWLVRDKDEPLPKWIHKVRFGSLRSYYEVATAHIWYAKLVYGHQIYSLSVPTAPLNKVSPVRTSMYVVTGY